MIYPDTYHESDVADDGPAVLAAIDRPPPPGGNEDYVLTTQDLVRLGIRGADDPADLSDLPGLSDECDGKGLWPHPSDCPCVECRMAEEISRLTEEARQKRQRQPRRESERLRDGQAPIETLPLFATDTLLGAALLGRDRIEEWKQLAPLLEARGLPKVDQIMGGRFVPAVRAFFMHQYGLSASTSLAPDGVEDFETWKRNPTRRV